MSLGVRGRRPRASGQGEVRSSVPNHTRPQWTRPGRGERRSSVVWLAASIVLALPLWSTSGTVAQASPNAAREAGIGNLWVDSNGGSCRRQAQPGAYDDSRACRGLQAAANAAVNGDLILIKDGTYDGEKLSGTKTLTFKGIGPGRPSFGQVVTSASNVTFRHLLIENRNSTPTPGCDNFVLDYTLFICGPHETFDDVIVDALHHPAGDPERKGGIEVTDGATRLLFRNGEVRGVQDSKGFQGGAANMLIENTVFHDIALTASGAAAGVHNECAYVTGGNGQTWRGNRFLFCPVMAMFFANFVGGPPFTGVTIENNVFTHSVNDGGSWHEGSSFVIPNGASGQNQVNNWVIRYNTFEVPPDFGSTPGTGDDNGSAKYYGNLGADGDCGAPEWTYSYNVGDTCHGAGEVSTAPATHDGSHPTRVPFYVDAAKGDFHLRAGSRAVNRGDVSSFPATDADGSNRPLASAPDAGAYESGTGLLALGGLDAGAAVQSRVAAAIRQFEQKHAANLLVTLGDNDYTKGRAFAVAWKSTFSWLGSARVKIAGALGDHDIRVRLGRYQFATLGMPAPYYVRRVRDAEVIVLDSNAVTAAQTRWLEQTLARQTDLFRVIVLNHSPFSCGAASDAAMRSRWVPLFRRYGVHLVLSGRDPSYQRFTVDRVTYVAGTVGAAAMGARPCLAIQAARHTAKRTSAFVYLAVDAAGAHVRAVSPSGTTIDAFDVR